MHCMQVTFQHACWPWNLWGLYALPLMHAAGTCMVAARLHIVSGSLISNHWHWKATDRGDFHCRQEVADCSESAYTQLKVSQAKALLMYPSESELLSHASQVRAIDWQCPAWLAAAHHVKIHLRLLSCSTVHTTGSTVLRAQHV